MGHIKIAGAGPAGLAAAISLAVHGYKVAVYEQRPDVGGRFNGDFQGLENWSSEQDVLDEIKEYGIEPNWWSRPFRGGSMFNAKLDGREVLTSRPLFYLVRRGNQAKTLDQALLEQAKYVGVDVVFNQRVPSHQADIWATGPSGTAKAIAAGITFRHPGDDLACVILSEDLAPSGYVYYLVADGQATLATVLFKDFSYVHTALEKSKQAIASIYALQSFPEEKKWGGYGGFSINQTCQVNGGLLVGEAGGFQDFLFGFGIRNAIVSGSLAARSLLEGKNYDSLWKARLLPMLKASAVNRVAYHNLGRVAQYAFWLAATRSRRPEKLMGWIYNASSLHKLFYRLMPKVYYSV